ncbi:hypothetical protein DFH09DRAFT_329956 [Mycena vulgaris]|nr:hypothetical protein DFH09DRAFT_329956 [Mycena vulgaris]
MIVLFTILLLLAVIVLRLRPRMARDGPAWNVYKKSWGREWPRRTGSIDTFHYTFFKGIRQIAQALGLSVNLQDILVLTQSYETIISTLESCQDSGRLFIIGGQPGIGKS